MAVILDGKAVSAKVKEEVKAEVEALKKQGVSVGLAVIIVGNNPASRTYVNNKRKPAKRRGLFPKNTPCPKKRPKRNCSRWFVSLTKKILSTAFSASCRSRNSWTKKPSLPQFPTKKTSTRSARSTSGIL